MGSHAPSVTPSQPEHADSSQFSTYPLLINGGDPEWDCREAVPHRLTHGVWLASTLGGRIAPNLRYLGPSWAFSPTGRDRGTYHALEDVIPGCLSERLRRNRLR